MKIMIADDEPDNRSLLQHILAPLGTCDFVSNGQEAIEACEMSLMDGKYYDLICLDIMMPKVDGHEALKKIRELEQTQRTDGREAVVFMVSAMDTETHVVKAFFHGYCTDYLTKPVTRDKMLDKLRQYNLIEA
ncbi:MAG: response regulator [Magnetococcus sp. DMHC-1]